jgi:hypothetical protein
MDNRDWEIVSYDTVCYYAQKNNAQHCAGESVLNSNLTKDEAMALLSLIGSPSKSTERDYYFFVC